MGKTLDELESDECLEKVLKYLKSYGMADKASVIKTIYDSDSTVAKKLKKEIDGVPNKDKIIPSLDMTALFLDLELPVSAYNKLKKKLQDFGHWALPVYKTHIKPEKDKCLPNKIKVSDTEAIVPTLEMLQKTFDRLILDIDIKNRIKQLMENFSDGQKLDLRLYYKTGFDGSGSQSVYKVIAIFL